MQIKTKIKIRTGRCWKKLPLRRKATPIKRAKGKGQPQGLGDRNDEDNAHLEIEIRGQGNADRLRDEIKTKSKWTEHKRGTVIYITGMDPDLKEEDITEALRKNKNDCENTNIEVLSLRQTQIGDLAAILRLDPAQASRLITAGRVAIGWNRCRVGARV